MSKKLSLKPPKAKSIARALKTTRAMVQKAAGCGSTIIASRTVKRTKTGC